MRESGYYRVKWKGSWVIAFYSGDEWYLIEYVHSYEDSDFEAIDENRIDPEPKPIVIKNPDFNEEEFKRKFIEELNKKPIIIINPDEV